MCAWCCLCQAAPGQQVFKERQSNLPLSTCDIGSFSCCISRVVINWLFQHSEHAMMLQAMPNPFCTKVTAIWKLVSTFLSTFQVPTCVKKKINEEFRTVFHYWQTQFLKLSGFSCRSPEVFYKSMGWRRSGFGGNTAGKIKTGKHEIMSNTGDCFWPWDIRADMNYWNYGSMCCQPLYEQWAGAVRLQVLLSGKALWSWNGGDLCWGSSLQLQLPELDHLLFTVRDIAV